MSDMFTTNKTVQQPINLTLKKSLGKKIAFLPNDAGREFMNLIPELLNTLLDNLQTPAPEPGVVNLLSRLSIQEYNAPPYSPGQCAEIHLDFGAGQYFPLGICVWSDAVSEQSLPPDTLVIDAGNVVDLTSSMFTVLSRLLAAAISEWTNVPVRLPTAVTPTGIHLDRLTKVFTNVSQPCSFTLPSAGDSANFITGDIIMTGAFLPDSQTGITSHICARTGSAHLKEYSSALLPQYVPNLLNDLRTIVSDVGRPPKTTWYNGFGFPSMALKAIAVTLNCGHQVPFILSLGSDFEKLCLHSAERTAVVPKLNHDPAITKTAEKLSKLMTNNLFARLDYIYEGNALTLIKDNTSTLKQWINNIFIELYQSSPQTLKYHTDQGIDDSLFANNIMCYQSVCREMGIEYRNDNAPIWECDLSSFTFWSVFISLNCYITVLGFINEIKQSPLNNLFLNPNGLKYLAEALAVGTLLTSTEVRVGDDIHLTECLDVPFITQKYEEYILDFCKNGSAPVSRIIALGAGWMYTHSQVSWSQLAILLTGLFESNKHTWLEKEAGSTAEFGENDMMFQFCPGRVIYIAIDEDNVLRSRFETTLSFGGKEDRYRTGWGLGEFTFQLNYQTGDVTLWDTIESFFLSPSLGNATSDFYTECLLPAGIKVKTPDALIHHLQQKIPHAERGAFKHSIYEPSFSVASSLSQIYLKMMNSGFQLTRVVPAMWLNTEFDNEIYEKDFCTYLSQALPPQTLNSLAPVLSSPDKYNPQLNAIFLLRDKQGGLLKKGKDFGVSMFMVAESFCPLLKGVSERDYNIFKLWLDLLSHVNSDNLLPGVIDPILADYQQLTSPDGIKPADVICRSRAALLFSLFFNGGGQQMSKFLSCVPHLTKFNSFAAEFNFSVEHPVEDMNPEEFVSWVLQTIAFLNSKTTEYGQEFLPYFMGFIRDVLRIYDPSSGELLEDFHYQSEDTQRTTPIIFFSPLDAFLSQGNVPMNEIDMMTMTECVNRSVVWLGCTPSVIAHHFIRSNFAFEITQDYIRVLTFINQFISHGYSIMYNQPVLLLKAIRDLIDLKNISYSTQEQEQWAQGIYFNALPVLHRSMIKGIVKE